MSDFIPSQAISRTRAGQDHYVSDIDETGLGAVDAVADESAPDGAVMLSWSIPRAVFRQNLLSWTSWVRSSA